MTKLSRREFIAIPFVPILVGSGAAFPLRANFPVPSLQKTPGCPPAPEDSLLSEPEDCPACHGLGRITCQACDGTRMWTEASESAGLYQREAARRADHCAWCDEWGEIICPECEGVAYRMRL